MDSLSFFRRNLKPLMAAMTLMAMISFLFLDDRRSGGGGGTFLVPVILAFLFGGGAFVWGTRKSKQNEYGTMGAVVGAVLGLVITQFGGRDTTQQSPIAGLSQREIANLKSRRKAANDILAEIFLKSHPVPDQFANNEDMRRFYQAQILGPQLQQIQFSFGNSDAEKDVIFGDLLRREAARLGISVNDDAVSDFIKMVSEGNFTKSMFREIKEKLRFGDHYIYELLRDELAARMAAEMTFPRAVTTPQQRWQDFRKVNVKQSIEATTIPVKDFTKSIPEPTDDQLRAFFQKYSEKAPSFKGEPGFFQPTRVRLAYLEADYDLLEKKVEQPTDEEVAKYYEDNKVFFEDRTPAKTDEKKDEATEGDDVKKPDEKKDADKSDSDKKEADKKDSDKIDADKKDGDKKEADKPADPTKGDDKPKEQKPADKSQPDGSQGAAGDDKVAADKPDEPKPADKPKKAEPKTEDDPKVAPKDDAQKDDPKAEDKKAGDKPKPETPDSKDKPAADADNLDKPGAKPDDKTEDNPGDKPDDKTAKKPEPKYKPFEEVKDKILDDLLRERTLKLMKSRIEKIIGDRDHGMRRLGSYTIAAKGEKPRRSPEAVASELKEFAESLDLKYGETPLLSAEELNNQAEDYKLGRATDPMDETFNRQGPVTVIQRVYGTGNDTTFTPEVAEDPGTKNRFAYWVIERVEAHVPKFEEEGIRQQVVKAWKLDQAVPKAEERAKALAKLAADGKKLTEVMAGQTVTGDKEGLQLKVIESPGKFAHYTMSGRSAPGLNPFQPGNERVELTQIPGLEKLGDDFFTAIDQMKPGTTAAIPNFDRSAFIVVHITDREEIAAEENAPQRADFLKSWLFSPPASELASNSFFPLRREWMESIEKKYNVKWPVK